MVTLHCCFKTCMRARSLQTNEKHISHITCPIRCHGNSFMGAIRHASSKVPARKAVSNMLEPISLRAFLSSTLFRRRNLERLCFLRHLLLVDGQAVTLVELANIRQNGDLKLGVSNLHHSHLHGSFFNFGRCLHKPKRYDKAGFAIFFGEDHRGVQSKSSGQVQAPCRT